MATTPVRYTSGVRSQFHPVWIGCSDERAEDVPEELVGGPRDEVLGGELAALPGAFGLDAGAQKMVSRSVEPQPFRQHQEAEAQGTMPTLDGYQPLMTKDEYLAFMRSNSREEVFEGA